jgi:flavin reductase (DIM6/NTAB) family NADH-FMN oxidoreductase RutF
MAVVDSPPGPRVSFDVRELSTEAVYKLLIGAVVPRPIAWVSTRLPGLAPNLAPFSFFTVASREPAVLAISIGQPGDPSKPDKDTLAGIRATGQFVVNIATRSLLDQLVTSSIEFPRGVDEFAATGLTPLTADVVNAPLVAEAPIAMECRLRDLVEIGTDVLVLGDVLRIHAHGDLVDERMRVRHDRLQPVGRLAGPSFCLDLDVVVREATARTVAGMPDPDGTGPARGEP